MLEGQRSGRPGQLTQPQQAQSEDIMNSGPGHFHPGPNPFAFSGFQRSS